MKKYGRQIIVRIPEELHAQLEEMAKARGQKLSDVVRGILSQHVAQKRTEEVVDSFLDIILKDEEIKALIAKRLKEE
jgi:predicted DNA-binding protein